MTHICQEPKRTQGEKASAMDAICSLLALVAALAQAFPLQLCSSNVSPIQAKGIANAVCAGSQDANATRSPYRPQLHPIRLWRFDFHHSNSIRILFKHTLCLYTSNYSIADIRSGVQLIWKMIWCCKSFAFLYSFTCIFLFVNCNIQNKLKAFVK